MTTDPPTGLDSPPKASERDLTLDLVQVTEAAALAAHAWVSRGNKNFGGQAAVTAMRDALAQLPTDGIVVIGEGEKDEAPMLNNGERVGTGTVARATGRDARDKTVCLLHRPRHENLIRQVHQAGARVGLLADGDVLGAVMAAMDGGQADLLLGTGGTPERSSARAP